MGRFWALGIGHPFDFAQGEWAWGMGHPFDFAQGEWAWGIGYKKEYSVFLQTQVA